MKSGLVWSIILSILLSMNGEIVSMFVIAQLAMISISFIRGSQPKCQKCKQNVFLCVIYI